MIEQDYRSGTQLLYLIQFILTPHGMDRAQRNRGIYYGDTFKKTGHICRSDDKESAVFRNDFFQLHQRG